VAKYGCRILQTRVAVTQGHKKFTGSVKFSYSLNKERGRSEIGYTRYARKSTANGSKEGKKET